MRWYRVLLVLTVALASTNAVPAPDQTRILTQASATLAATISSSAESSKPKNLRAEKPAAVDSFSLKDIDRGENWNHVKDYPGNDKVNPNESEVRTGGTGAIRPLVLMMEKTNSLRDKVSKMLSFKAKLRIWSDQGKSVYFVRTELGLDGLFGADFTGAKNFRYYDDFVTSQLPIWSKKGLSPDEVLAMLGFHGWLGSAIRADPDFKYYDEYMTKQTLVWSKENVPVDDVFVKLGLNALKGKARSDSVNFKYYDEFLLKQLRSWLENEVPVSTVMANLKLDKLTGDDLLSHPNYEYYKRFVNNNLRSWASKWNSMDEVAEKLDLKNLQGKTLENHPNYRFLKEYGKKSTQYREEGWIKQGVTTFEVWNKYKVDRVHLSHRRTSATYKMYKRYVNRIDKYIIKLKNRGFDELELPRLIDTKATPEELFEKTLIWTSVKRPEWYVKFALGLDHLGPNLLKESPNYKYYEYYLEGVKRRSVVAG